ncbi:hypothetical protein AMATHDRAFT_67957 [Amanita thiersii Skay4041]|uniref:Uncharacterized protein n=1 Tax=Amanita thiersii Skay4041 TaxID=703135 RepID=A0A2A9NHW9_9AGAR|nr:hypothetical protein AMATHDRAFT_67957 [Amanita thiersii Skay4041]
MARIFLTPEHSQTRTFGDSVARTSRTGRIELQTSTILDISLFTQVALRMTFLRI